MEQALGQRNGRPARADPFKKVGTVLADHSGLYEKADKLLICFKAHIILKPGIEVPAGDAAEIANAIGQRAKRAGCSLRLFVNR